jgi:hypothetical protein
MTYSLTNQEVKEGSSREMAPERDQEVPGPLELGGKSTSGIAGKFLILKQYACRDRQRILNQETLWTFNIGTGWFSA